MDPFVLVAGEDASVYRRTVSGNSYDWALITNDNAAQNPQILPFNNADFTQVKFNDGMVYLVGGNNQLWRSDKQGASDSWVNLNNFVPLTGNVTAFNVKDGNVLVFGNDASLVTDLRDEAGRYTDKFFYDELGRLICSQNSKPLYTAVSFQEILLAGS